MREFSLFRFKIQRLSSHMRDSLFQFLRQNENEGITSECERASSWENSKSKARERIKAADIYTTNRGWGMWENLQHDGSRLQLAAVLRHLLIYVYCTAFSLNLRSSLLWDVARRMLVNWLQTFRYNISVPSSRVKKSKKKTITTLRCVISHKIADLTYTTVEAWKEFFGYIYNLLLYFKSGGLTPIAVLVSF
jgi:hypothetical protein